MADDQKVYDQQGSYVVETIEQGDGAHRQVVHIGGGTISTGAATYGTATHAEVTAGVAASEALASDVNRTMWRIYNTSNSDSAYISLDGGDATSSDWVIRPGEAIGSQELGICTGSISCIRDSNDVTLKVVSA